MTTDPDDMVGWQRLGPEITTSGRLEAGDVARLAALGVRQVINLAMADSPGALADEAELLSAAGMAYTHIPVPFAAPDEGHLAAFLAALEAGERPLHVHCIANYRVSAFFYRHNRASCGMAEADARALMERHWRPEASDHADMRTWAAFIAKGTG